MQKSFRGCLKSLEMCRCVENALAARRTRNGVSLPGYLFREQRRAECVPDTTPRARTLLALGGVALEAQGLVAWAPRARLVHEPKSSPAAHFQTLKAAS